MNLLVTGLVGLLFAAAAVQGRVVTRGGEILQLGATRSEKIWTVYSNNVTNDAGITVDAEVPGGIYSDLDAANTFETEIYEAYNDLDTRWVGRTNWTYVRQFTVTDAMKSMNYFKLVCEGLDTVANVKINGILVGSSSNMFTRYVWDIKSALNMTDENEIEVEFMSPVEYATREWERLGIKPDSLVPEYQGEDHANHIRKMQASFSWDWGPSYPSSGIWKNIYIQAYNNPVIRDVLIFTSQSSDKLTRTVTARTYLDWGGSIDNSGLRLNFTLANRQVSRVNLPVSADYHDVSVVLPEAEVELWWPNGYGNQTLYPGVVALDRNGILASEATFNVGIRTVELVEEPINNANENKGNQFYVKVNDVPIYSKGSNSIPIHVLPERVTRETTEWLFQSAKAAHMNMIRVWGGGIYESDDFFDLADETGVMIWEDFMFACAMYPAEASFLANVKSEVETQVKRLQHHASLAIWAANNENEAALRDNWYGTEENFNQYKYEFIRLYVDTVMANVNILDPSRQILSSSPTNGIKSQNEGWVSTNPYSNNFGDIHFYNYRDDSWDWRTLKRTRYASEYGYQSWPSVETFAASTSAEDWSWKSAMMMHRQHHPGGQDEIPVLIEQNLPLPADHETSEKFVSLLRLNWIQQAMAYKTQTEFYRRLKNFYDDYSGEGLNMGALYWQLNDIWPGASWATIEWNGRWKLVHYYAIDFFAPILTSPYVDYVNDTKEIAVLLVSDMNQRLTGSVEINLFHFDSQTPLKTATVNFTATELNSVEVARWIGADLEGCSDQTPCFVTTSTKVDGQEETAAPDNFVFLQYPKDGSLIADPGLNVTNIKAAEENTFTFDVTSQNVALFVNLNMKNETIVGTFSDNGFIMVRNTTTVTFKSRWDLTLEEFENNLEFWSLYDLIDEDVKADNSGSGTIRTSFLALALVACFSIVNMLCG